MTTSEAIRTQHQRVTVRAYSREEAQRYAAAKAWSQWPDREHRAGPWHAAEVTPMTVPAGFDRLFAGADLRNLYVVDVYRVVRP